MESQNNLSDQPATDNIAAEKTNAEKIDEYFLSSPTIKATEKTFRLQAINDVQELLSKMRAELKKIVS